MINVNSTLTAEEVSLMEAYRSNYGGEPHSHVEGAVPFVELLEHYWAKEKEPIYRAFGEKLILSKHIEYSVPRRELGRMLINALDKTPSVFIRYLHEHFNDFGNCIETFNGYRYSNIYQFIHYNVMTDDYEYLFEEKYDGAEAEIALPDGKTLKVQKGIRPMKLLGKLSTAFNIPGYEEFRILQSQILNTAKLHGELCVSIHPLDYITLSENDSNWSSCMNWHDRGCYRRGTVEMMNSPFVVVAYLKGENDMHRFGCAWNNKKWRQLFILTREAIVGIKAYPYSSDNLSRQTAIWLAEILNAAGGNYDVSNCQRYEYDCGEFSPVDERDGKKLSMDFETDTMYNDFGCDVYHTILCDKDYYEDPSEISPYYNYSGVAQCIMCGKEVDYEATQEQLVCDKCGGRGARCDYCGCQTYDEELIEVDDEFICQYCYHSNSASDIVTGERHMRGNFRYRYYVTNSEEWDSNSWCYSCFLYTNVSPESEEWEALFPEVRVHTSGWMRHSYINYRECSPEAQKIIARTYEEICEEDFADYLVNIA